MLQIKYVQPRDAGLYECQISTEPKMAHRIRLNVLVPKIRLVFVFLLFLDKCMHERLQNIVENKICIFRSYAYISVHHVLRNAIPMRYEEKND